MALDPRTPCLVGVAQHTVREPPAPEPLLLWELVAREAVADAGTPGLLARLDSVQVVNCVSWPYDDPVGRLCARIGASPSHHRYSGMGGNVPQLLVAEAAEAIGRGELDIALVVGGEALATRRWLRKAGERPAWSHRAAERTPDPTIAAPHPSELAHDMYPAWMTFVLLDVARRGRRGDSLDAERAERGAMMAPMTEVAATNPHAWFPVRRGPDELVTPSADNRLVGWPYTKHTTAVMDVDMAAAVVLASTAAADALGVPPERRVYLRGWAHAEDPPHLAAREDLAGSPAMRAASGAALRRAGVGVEEIGCLDLYSCFASSLRFACDALGLDPLDARGLTVTGGLPYAGGPASDYVLHAVASMAERLREGPAQYGLLSGVGMHMTKHVYAVWSSEPGPPPTGGRVGGDPGWRRIAHTYEGPATVAAYTVAHGRDGEPEYAVLIVDLPHDGARAYARTNEPGLLADAESRELVGQPVRISTDGRVNTASW